ncbi:MAG: hypothetical protein LBB72_07040 [Spirochaetaceae bacterium]|jgi:hypothetical protein|nr:hypothetical protein [Spirochaetaceae bacterium]
MKPAETLPEESTSFFDDDKEPSLFEKVFYRVTYCAKNFFRGIKYGFQKLIRPYHVSDWDLWDLDALMAKMLYPKILAFKKMERHGYPSAFSEYSKNEWKSKDEYENAVKEGKIKGGGPEAWEKVLDEIIFAFEWHLYCKDTIGTDKKGIKFFEKYGYKNPYAKTEENKSVSYVYRMSEKYINEQVEKSPDLKEFGGLAPECLSDESDLHIKEPENYTFIKESIRYSDTRYIVEIGKRALEGFRLFGEYFTNFWD